MQTVEDVFLYLFLIGLFIYGSYMTLGALRNWRKFIYSQKRIDLIKIFGDFGRVLYVIIGLAVCTVAVLLFMKKIGIGPLVGQK